MLSTCSRDERCGAPFVCPLMLGPWPAIPPNVQRRREVAKHPVPLTEAVASHRPPRSARGLGCRTCLTGPARSTPRHPPQVQHPGG